MKKTRAKVLSILLSVCMVVSLLPTVALAAEDGTTIGASGLCEHHTEHTADCGYTEGTPEAPCAHKVNGGEADREGPLGGEHGDECYKEVTKCVHEHTEDCYDDSEDIATDSEAREPVNCAHICDEESGCITKALDCQHEHDEDCGYAAAVPGTPCTFQCEECASSALQSTGQNRANPAFTSPNYLTCGENGGMLDLAVSGFTPTSYSLSGTVPEGVSVQEDEGTWALVVLYGAPVGVHTFTVNATDGNTTITQTFTLTVNPDSATVTTTIDCTGGTRQCHCCRYG